MADSKVLQIEGKIDRDQMGAIAVSKESGALDFVGVGEMMDFAKLMAVSDKAVPSYLRGNVGSCLAIVTQSNAWKMDPFLVARMSFVVGDTIGYMSQLIHALVIKRAKLKERPRFAFVGEGQDKIVTVTAHFIGEVDPLVYTSPKIKDIKPKNSPLWVNDPEQQLSYYGVRAWARRYAPDVLLGVYDADELERSPAQIGPDNAKEINPLEEQLHHRLSAKAVVGAGFDASAIATTIGEVAKRDAPSPSVSEPLGQPAHVSETERAAPDAKDVPASTGSGAAVVSEASPEATVELTSPPAAQSPSAVREPAGGGPTAPPAGQEPPAAPTEPPQVASEPSKAPADGPKPAVPPKDGGDYPRWVDENLPDFETPAEVDVWWKSEFERKLRNSLPNLTQEIVDAAKAKVAERKKQLRKEV